MPRNLFSNQIAQFLNVSENDGETIYIFLLDNPLSNTDFNQSSWLTDELRAVYECHKANNFQLVHVIFSYDTSKPANVNRQASKHILKKITKAGAEESDDFVQKILYIDNQNRNGAAICLDKDGHDIMIPRMLCDFMMLLSNKDDKYNVATAITGSQTCAFSVGYSECMYYHDDVFRYFRLAGERDLLKFLLTEKNAEDSLDYTKYPIGIEDRLGRLKSKYYEVPFTEDIENYPDSIDKSIDDILIFFKDDIINIHKSGSVSSIEKDETENDIGTSRDTADDTGKRAQKYPEYIDRGQIYEEYSTEKAEGDDFEGTRLPVNIDRYKNLIRFIQTRTFKNYVEGQCEKEKNEREAALAVPEEKVKKTCFLKRWFCCKKKADIGQDTDISEKDETATRDWHESLQKIQAIKKMYQERASYAGLQKKAVDLHHTVQELDRQLKEFKLTEHCTSVDNLIDLERLETFHQDGKDKRLERIINKWNSKKEEEKTLDALFDILKEDTKWEVYDFYYIKWSEPFPFIKEIDLQKVCEKLKRKSQPFVNTFTLEANAENLTTYVFYTDNDAWNEELTQKNVKVQDANKVLNALSRHICSKICMFQFLQMTSAQIKGLVDCYEDPVQAGEISLPEKIDEDTTEESDSASDVCQKDFSDTLT